MRPLLRIGGYWLLFAILLVPITSQSGVTFSPQVHRVMFGVLGTALILLITWIFIQSENKALKDYALVPDGNTTLKFFGGLAIGIGSNAILILILVVLTDFQILLNPKMPSLTMSLWYLGIVPAAFMEELAFRSYSFLKLNKLVGLRIAQIMTAMAFALYHVPLSWTVSVALLGPGIWSLVFGITAIYSKGISMPTGIHIGINFVQAIVGMSAGVESFWVITENENDSDFVVSLSRRLMVLSAGILLTEFYIRKAKKGNLRNQ